MLPEYLLSLHHISTLKKTVRKGFKNTFTESLGFNYLPLSSHLIQKIV